MKKIYLLAAAAALFAACSSDKVSLDTPQQPQLDNNAVGFDAYLQRTTTRAGYSEKDMELADLQSEGFGVHAYYTDNRDYDQLAVPNFMYNTKVSTSSWTYSPIMYWPNEYGNTAVSDDADKVTFFAYAPYVEVTPSTGKPVVEASVQSAYENANTDYETARTNYLTAKKAYYGENSTGRASIASDWTTAKTNWTTAKTNWATAQKTYYKAGGGEFGITGMTRNTAAGDPIIKYVSSFNAAQSVDLLWGVCQQSDWQLVEGGQAQDIKLGTPWLDVHRPAAVDQKLKFQFLHALAKMQITIDEFNDDTKLNGAVNEKTRIWIRSVRFTGFTMKGALNLNNETAYEPYWMNYNGIGDLVADNDLTVYDGRKDGKEGMEGATATNEKVLGLNEKFIEDNTCYDYKLDDTTPYATAWTDVPTGVDHQTTSLFEGGGIFYVIPTGDAMQVEIVYDVETIDPNLGTYLADGKTPGSSIENRITKNIEFGNGINVLKAGKAYNIKLHLGMNSVKFDADVVAWDDMAAPDIDLPANMPQYPVTTGGNMDIPGAATETVFAITGLKGGEAITAVTCGLPGVTPATHVFVNSTSKFPGDIANCDKRANASGVVYVKVTNITPNTGITNLTAKNIVVTGAISGATTIAVVQKASPLAMAAPDPKAAGNKSYKLTRTPASPELSDWLASSTDATPVPADIKVWCDGAELTVANGTSAPTGEENVNFDKGSGTLWFASNRTSGQVIKVYIKAGDVPAETISFTID